MKYMKIILASVLIMFLLSSCGKKKTGDKNEEFEKPTLLSIAGTWKLLNATVIEKGDTIVTDYTQNKSFIKIINYTHFAFLQHDLKNGKDSTASFVAGGGTFTLTDSLYTEHLEYCSMREWEGHEFPFKVILKKDTLIQSGVEIVESAGINRINIEKYVKIEK